MLMLISPINTSISSFERFSRKECRSENRISGRRKKKYQRKMVKAQLTIKSCGKRMHAWFQLTFLSARCGIFPKRGNGKKHIYRSQIYFFIYNSSLDSAHVAKITLWDKMVFVSILIDVLLSEVTNVSLVSFLGSLCLLLPCFPIRNVWNFLSWKELLWENRKIF